MSEHHRYQPKNCGLKICKTLLSILKAGNHNKLQHATNIWLFQGQKRNEERKG
jgi:hypothetical protein